MCHKITDLVKHLRWSFLQKLSRNVQLSKTVKFIKYHKELSWNIEISPVTLLPWIPFHMSEKIEKQSKFGCSLRLQNWKTSPLFLRTNYLAYQLIKNINKKTTVCEKHQGIKVMVMGFPMKLKITRPLCMEHD